jgi:hypothetical protein
VNIVHLENELLSGIQVFWDVMLCHLASGYRHFEGNVILPDADNKLSDC